MNASRETGHRPCVRAAGLLASLAFGVSAAQTVSAQNAPGSSLGNPGSAGALQEVVVTATKEGAHPVDDVPMAIQAFTAESLVSKGVRQTLDLIELIPGASERSEIGAGYRIFSFRGSGAGGRRGSCHPRDWPCRWSIRH